MLVGIFFAQNNVHRLLSFNRYVVLQVVTLFVLAKSQYRNMIQLSNYRHAINKDD